MRRECKGDRDLLAARAGTLADTGWFDSAQLAGLREAGVTTVTELVRRGTTVAGRSGLQTAAGVDAATVTTWLRRGALSLLATVDAAEATLLVAVGLRSIAELARRGARRRELPGQAADA